MTSVPRGLSALALAASLCPAAQAEVIAYGANTTSAGTGDFVDLANAGSTMPDPTTLEVRIERAGHYALTFSANCELSNPDGNPYQELLFVNLSLVVNDQAIPVSFCGQQSSEPWPPLTNVHASVTQPVWLNHGRNTVRVQVLGGGGYVSAPAIVIQ